MDKNEEPSSVKASIKYIKWQELYEKEKPFQIFIDIRKDAVDQRYHNLVFENKQETFFNIRGREQEFRLDDHGFAYHHHHFNFDDYEDRVSVESSYLPQVESFIRNEVEEVDKVFFFDWRLRHSGSYPKGTEIDLNDPTDWLLPSIHAHIDQAPGAVLNRTLLQLPDEAEFLLQGRVRVITVWKPLRNPVEDWPLAVCDGSNVEYSDMVETDHVRRLYTGANMNVMYRAKYRWHYLHKQSESEVLLLKQFDSASNVKARFSPHVSFEHPNVPTGAPRRESIEVRALVFTYAHPNGSS